MYLAAKKKIYRFSKAYASGRSVIAVSETTKVFDGRSSSSRRFIRHRDTFRTPVVHTIDAGRPRAFPANPLAATRRKRRKFVETVKITR